MPEASSDGVGVTWLEIGCSSANIVEAAEDWRDAGMQLHPYSDRNVGRDAGAK
jgi:hypothetical protein